MNSEKVIQADVVRDYCISLFLSQGLPADEAFIAADSLVEANLAGVDSHGVSRMPIYIKRLQEKVVNNQCRLRIINEAPAMLALDGCNSMGSVVGVRAMEMAIKKARENGAAVS